jgi:probable HAF family extracellular repeat protein
MCAARTVNTWINAWGLTLFSIGIFHFLPTQAQQDTLTDKTERGDDAQDHNPKHHHYRLVDLGTFGGPNTNFVTQGVGAQVLNNRGVVTGSADTSISDPNAPSCLSPDCFVSHAFKWQKGSLTDLGSLPGVNTSFGSWISGNGLVAGLSGNGEIDPLTGFPETRAVLWSNGSIVDLGTFGGNESLANAVNNRGQVVGSAANAIPDPFNTGTLYGWGTQMHAFLWEDGVMRDLGTLGGPDSLAYYVNEAGQVAGFSYTSYTPNPLTGVPPGHPFLWENGTMHDLGTIGGTQVNQLNALNERGQMVGSMTLADEDAKHVHPFLWDGETLLNLGTLGGNFGEANWLNDAGEVVGHADTSIACPGGTGPIGHAFLWKNGAMQDLGTVPGIDPLDGLSAANGINSKTQIVGISNTCDNSINDAFLWEKGSMADLNNLVPPNSALHLLVAFDINDREEITGFGVLPNGDAHTFLLIPCDENHADVEGCEYDMVDEAAATRQSSASAMQEPTTTTPSTAALNGPSNAVRTMLRGRLGVNRFMGAQQVALSGALAATSGPIATLSPTSESFSTEPIGTTSAAQSVTLKNTGTTSLTISRITISGPDARDYAQTHTCGSSLAAHASCNVSVTFNPMASGMRTAALSVTDNAAGSPQKVTLSGIGTAAKLSPTSLSFGSVGLRATSLPKTITLTNVGTTTLSITGISISGPNAGDFAQSHTCGSSLVAGASCTLRVTFTPAVLGARTATLNVTDNAAGSPQKVALSGVGVAGGKLTGSCVMGRIVGPPGCAIVPDRTQCTPGKPAINPVVVECGGPFRIDVDEGASCHLPGPFIGGRCQWTP